MYYLTLSVGILSAFCIYELAKKWTKGMSGQNALILALPFVALSLYFAKPNVTQHPYVMTPDI